MNYLLIQPFPGVPSPLTDEAIARARRVQRMRMLASDDGVNWRSDLPSIDYTGPVAIDYEKEDFFTLADDTPGSVQSLEDAAQKLAGALARAAVHAPLAQRAPWGIPRGSTFTDAYTINQRRVLVGFSSIFAFCLPAIYRAGASIQIDHYVARIKRELDWMAHDIPKQRITACIDVAHPTQYNRVTGEITRHAEVYPIDHVMAAAAMCNRMKVRCALWSHWACDQPLAQPPTAAQHHARDAHNALLIEHLDEVQAAA